MSGLTQNGDLGNQVAVERGAEALLQDLDRTVGCWSVRPSAPASGVTA